MGQGRQMLCATSPDGKDSTRSSFRQIPRGNREDCGALLLDPSAGWDPVSPSSQANSFRSVPRLAGRLGFPPRPTRIEQESKQTGAQEPLRRPASGFRSCTILESLSSSSGRRHGERLLHRTWDSWPDTAGKLASAEDTTFDARQNVVCFFEPFLRGRSL